MEGLKLKSELGGLLLVLIIALLVSYYAKRRGFYKFPYPPSFYPISFKSVLGAFGIYLGAAFILFPLIYLIIGWAVTGSLTSIKNLSKDLQSWLQLSSIFVLFGLMILYCYALWNKGVDLIFWGEKSINERTPRAAFKHLGMGFLTWLISYPVVVFISGIAGIIAFYLFGKRGVEQDAVKVIKQALEHPLRLTLLIISVSVLVPIIEEILFRGFLQTWLRNRIGRKWGLILTAFIFAVVHFSYSQGTGNFELLIALFVLSLFLGFIYERQKSLFAPIGLHMAFNGLTVIGILIAAKTSS